MSQRRLSIWMLVCLSGAVSRVALAADGGADAGAFPAVPPPPVLDAGSDAAAALPVAPEGVGGCVEHVPGKARPTMTEQVPARGLSGHVVELTIKIEHGKGETVMPTGFHLDYGSDEAKALESAGFILPDPEGGAGPVVKVETKGDRATTTVKIPFVPLPKKAGRHHMTLPPVPIAVARASGEVLTLCTEPHAIVVEDPTSSTPHAKPRQNPPPRPQREEWTLAKNVAVTALIALVVGALVAWLIGRWMKRPRPEPAPPPPRPPWEVALEELFDIRHAGLITAERYTEHYDRVSHTVRKYLGDRYGFDGLESTTREIMGVLAQVVPGVPVMPQIEIFLREADLVKFARLTPTEQDCETALGRGEEIVRATVPPRFGPEAPPSPAGADPGAPVSPAFAEAPAAPVAEAPAPAEDPDAKWRPPAPTPEKTDEEPPAEGGAS